MKKYIYAMALSRRHAISKLDSLSPKINEHVIKCVVYGKYQPRDLDGWISEIAGWMFAADRTAFVGAKLKDKDYVDSLFGQFGTDSSDAEDNLLFFEYTNLKKREGQNTRLPYFRVNDTLKVKLFRCYNEMKKEIPPILREREEHSKMFWNSFVRDIIDEYLYDLKDSDIVEDIYHIE